MPPLHVDHILVGMLLPLHLWYESRKDSILLGAGQLHQRFCYVPVTKLIDGGSCFMLSVPSGGKCGATDGKCAAGLCCSKIGNTCGTGGSFCDACLPTYSSSTSCVNAGERRWWGEGACFHTLSAA
jgi:hypothetical protein